VAKKPKSSKTRVDAALVARALADSPELARALVMAGKVLVGAGERKVAKPSELVADDEPLRVKDAARFVSRAGEKLLFALEDLRLTETVRGQTVLDVGASTGGFTQCCLELGAARVLALDVGVNQLAWELRTDPRVTALERTDVREFAPADHPAVDLLVADVSFNSLARLAPALRRAAPGPQARFLVLVKPQFELPRRLIPDGGVVSDDDLRAEAVRNVAEAFAALGLPNGRAVDCRVAGRTGNREIFYYVSAYM
jgi:23S rRNA (cytidine1920-2'-O)/16S rRNA (cytidine1409-2'-O)-methyltransferase